MFWQASVSSQRINTRIYFVFHLQKTNIEQIFMRRAFRHVLHFSPDKVLLAFACPA